jgi:hypothetical protein
MQATRETNSLRMSMMASYLNDYAKDAYLEQLCEVVNDALMERRRCLQANSSYFNFPIIGRVNFGDFARGWHRKRAQLAPDSKSLVAGEAVDGSALMATLKGMSYDDGFAGLAEPLKVFIARRSGLCVPSNFEECSLNVSVLANIFPADSVVAQRFQVLKPLLLARVDKLRGEYVYVQKFVDQAQSAVDKLGDAIGVSLENCTNEEMELEVAARYPQFHAQPRLASPAKLSVGAKDSECLGSGLDVLDFCREGIYTIVKSKLFNPKLRRGYGGGIFKQVQRGVKQFFGRSVQSRRSASAQDVIYALDSGFGPCNIADVLARFKAFWFKKGVSEEQRFALQKLSGYEKILRSQKIAVAAPEISEIGLQVVEVCKQTTACVKNIKKQLKTSSEVRELFRSKSITEVVEVCQKPSKRHIVPQAAALDGKNYRYISRYVLRVANRVFGCVDHGLSFDEDNAFLKSNDPVFNDFLSKVYQASKNFVEQPGDDCVKLCSSRCFTLLLLGLAIRMLDTNKAHELKALLIQATADKDLLGKLRHCKSLQEDLKGYFPRWEGLFLPDVSLREALLVVKPIKPSGFLAFSDVDTSADVNNPKDSMAIAKLSYDQLHFYAEAVCDKVISATLGWGSRKKAIHPFLERFFKIEDGSLRQGHKSLKFLLAMLEWYSECKIDTAANLTKSTADYKVALNFLNKLASITGRIRHYLRHDGKAMDNGIDMLCLGELLTLDYKREPDGSFNKLLSFVALEYRDANGHLLCDLKTQFSIDTAKKTIERQQRNEEKKGKGYFFSSMFGFASNADKSADAALKAKASLRHASYLAGALANTQISPVKAKERTSSFGSLPDITSFYSPPGSPRASDRRSFDSPQRC